jgi:hypothetical protein
MIPFVDRRVVQLTEAIAGALTQLIDIRVAWLFGSQLDRPRADSDLDVAVAYRPDLGARERELARREVVYTLAGVLGAVGERADVVDVDRCDSAVAFRAIRHGVRVLSRTEAERIDAEVRIARRYQDDEPRRRLYHDALRRYGAAR